MGGDVAQFIVFLACAKLWLQYPSSSKLAVGAPVCLLISTQVEARSEV